MATVFLSGSRRTKALNEIIRERLDKIVEQELSVLIGDADGADTVMQTYLADRRYTHVTVFCSGPDCRNNIGNWNVCNIETNSQAKNFQFYAMKDKAMSQEADYALMLWDGKSKGTLNNVLNMLEHGKQSAVYFSLDKQFHTISSEDDLMPLLAQCSPDRVRVFERDIKLDKRVVRSPSQLTLL